MKKAKLIALLVLVIVFGIFAGCSNNSESNNDANSDAESKSADADGTLELRLGHIFPVDSVKDRAANMFAERIEEETNGKIKITVYPASQLGGDEVMAKDISRGTLDMSFINQGSLAGLDPLLDFHYLPYIVTNYEEADKIYYGDGIIPKLMEETLLKYDMVTLGLFENEFRGVSNSVKPISSVEDLKGLKLRVPGSQAIYGFFEKAGVQAEVMPFDELYMGLQQGTVDGQDNGLLLTYDSNFHEVNKYYTLLNHVYATGSIVINKQLFESLSEEEQEIFKRVGKEVQEWQVAENRKEVQNYREKMEAEGVEFTDLTEEQIREFQEFGISQWDDYADVYGEDRINALKEELEALK